MSDKDSSKKRRFGERDDDNENDNDELTEQLAKRTRRVQEQERVIARLREEGAAIAAAGGASSQCRIPLIDPSELDNPTTVVAIDIPRFIQRIEATNVNGRVSILAVNPTFLYMLAASAYFMGTQQNSIIRIDESIAPLREYLSNNFGRVLGAGAERAINWVISLSIMGVRTIAHNESQPLVQALGGNVYPLIRQMFYFYAAITLTRQSTNVLSLLQRLPDLSDNIMQFLQDFSAETGDICKSVVGAGGRVARGVAARLYEVGGHVENAYSILTDTVNGLLFPRQWLEDNDSELGSLSSHQSRVSQLIDDNNDNPELLREIASQISEGILMQAPLNANASTDAQVNLQVNVVEGNHLQVTPYNQVVLHQNQNQDSQETASDITMSDGLSQYTNDTQPLNGGSNTKKRRNRKRNNNTLQKKRKTNASSSLGKKRKTVKKYRKINDKKMSMPSKKRKRRNKK